MASPSCEALTSKAMAKIPKKDIQANVKHYFIGKLSTDLVFRKKLDMTDHFEMI